ncbi:hypothetical protein [Streptomyces sp. NPDC056105]|uniref:plasmid mobilization protein n=1 Tax=Streptomyces sp. NPDC056105 TaxID=3345714 RepID=UPI0035D63BB6
MASKKQINVRVDADVYEGIEQRAAAVGMEVNEYARQVLADEANDLRHRFLDAGAHFAGQWGPQFAEEFGQGASPRGQAA